MHRVHLRNETPIRPSFAHTWPSSSTPQPRPATRNSIGRRHQYDRSGRSSGVAVVTFETPAEATRAKKQFDGILAKSNAPLHPSSFVVAFGWMLTWVYARRPADGDSVRLCATPGEGPAPDSDRASVAPQPHREAAPPRPPQQDDGSEVEVGVALVRRVYPYP